MKIIEIGSDRLIAASELRGKRAFLVQFGEAEELWLATDESTAEEFMTREAPEVERASFPDGDFATLQNVTFDGDGEYFEGEIVKQLRLRVAGEAA